MGWVTLFWDEEEKGASCTHRSPTACPENKPWSVVFITSVAISDLQER